MAKKKTTTKKSASTKGTKKKVAPKNDGQGISKQSAIVAVAKANPDMSAKDAAEKVKADFGLDVSAGYYSDIKSNWNRGLIDDTGKSVKGANRGKTTTKKSRRGRRPAATKAAGDVTADDVLAAKEFADSVGGVEKASAALEFLGQLA